METIQYASFFRFKYNTSQQPATTVLDLKHEGCGVRLCRHSCAHQDPGTGHISLIFDKINELHPM